MWLTVEGITKSELRRIRKLRHTYVNRNYKNKELVNVDVVSSRVTMHDKLMSHFGERIIKHGGYRG